MNENNLAALGLEPEVDGTKRHERVFDRLMFFFGSVEHQKPALPGPQELSARCSGFSGFIVPLVDAARGDSFAHGFFQQPVFVKKLAETVEIILLKVRAHNMRE